MAAEAGGNAADRRNFIGQWSDKTSESPEKFQLTETHPFKKGSLSRTVAHELGHILGLKHPDKTAQTEFDRLMGGKRPCYKLTTQEIETARQQATALKNPL